MGKTSSTLIFLTSQDVIDINHYHIEHTDGLHIGANNLRTPGSLEWVINAIEYPMFGVDPYPTIEEKAAQLAWIIIDGHVFHDGNKRTGISSMLAFLEMNDYLLLASHNELIEVALNIATGRKTEYQVETLVDWLRKRIQKA